MTNGVSSPESVGFSSQRLSRVNKMMQGYIDDGKLANGLTMLARHGETFHFEPYGMLDLESGTPVERDTLFRIYSMTKPITSAAVMMLYEQGYFSLDDPVGKFIPELASLKVYDGMGETGMRLVDQKQPITVRHLLTHTSGLSYGFHQDSPIEEMYREANVTDPDSTLKEMAEKLGKLPLVTQPGTKWRYSNATDVLGYLVEVVSGTPFDRYLQDNILEPLGMTDTSFYVSEENLDRLATVYGAATNGKITPLDNPMVNRQRRPHTLFSGGGGLVSTGSDYMRFCQMLLNGGILGDERLLAPKTVEMMRSNHLTDDMRPFAVGQSNASDTKGCGFGLGFRVVMDIAQHGIIGSNGIYSWGGAASTVFWIDPQEDLVAILLTQFMPSSHYPLRREFQIATYQALVE
ncbi:MAG: beta-lactamase family protein [Chloroflexi bacterium]|nr:beta-lactamase family protein [Chloroflexota bacterium]